MNIYSDSNKALELELTIDEVLELVAKLSETARMAMKVPGGMNFLFQPL